MNLPDVEGMALFVKIMEHGSLSAAGRALGIPKGTVSRRLAELEARLGLQLLNRSTRSLSLTDAGRAYHQRCAPIVAEAEAAELEVLAKTGAPTGRIRLAAAAGLGQLILMPLLLDFLHRHPGISLDLEFADRRVDLIAEGFDLAIRLGELEDSSLIARRLATYARVLVASPDYLAHAPPLDIPDDLRRHACILISADRQSWTLQTADGDVVIRVPWRLAVQNIFSVRDAALAGLGIAMVPAYVVNDDLAAGRLVRVLQAATVTPVTANALFPPSKTQSIAVRRFIDFLADALREPSCGA
jgi:DNA-binding transcriptional LysR family regulator